MNKKLVWFWKAVFNVAVWIISHPAQTKAIITLILSVAVTITGYAHKYIHQFPPDAASLPWLFFAIALSFLAGIKIIPILFGKYVYDIRRKAAGRINDIRYLRLEINYRVDGDGHPIEKLVKRQVQNTSKANYDWEPISYKTFGVDSELIIKGQPVPTDNKPYVEVEAIDGGRIEPLSKDANGYGRAKFCFDKVLLPGESMLEPYIYRLTYHLGDNTIPPYAQFQPRHDTLKLVLKLKFAANGPEKVLVTYWQDGLNQKKGQPWAPKHWSNPIEPRPNREGYVEYEFPQVIKGESDGTYTGYGLSWFTD